VTNDLAIMSGKRKGSKVEIIRLRRDGVRGEVFEVRSSARIRIV